MRTFLRLAVLKLVSLMLVGTAEAQPIRVPAPNKIDRFAHAIARAEGFNVPGSIPNRLHNPGDITASSVVYPGQLGVQKGYAVFRSDKDGWAALKNQIQRMIDGTSTRYDQSMTFAQIARVYAQDKRWGTTVCKILNIDPRLTFQEYFDLAPRVKFTEATWPNRLTRNLLAPNQDVVIPRLMSAESVEDATPVSTSTSNELMAVGGNDVPIFDGIL